jgi:hypothetical protein
MEQLRARAALTQTAAAEDRMEPHGLRDGRSNFSCRAKENAVLAQIIARGVEQSPADHQGS